ncbi:MAG: flagellar basal body-associated FliL family protein [Calditerrivibrio sp.]|nr:flagellar basal body-associated FliL family protein [Calditerrivibrio sp.]MCA1932359.1 flagellar basal body-associated FliL family protein [Calditerrivibrio sp.]
MKIVFQVIGVFLIMSVIIFFIYKDQITSTFKPYNKPKVKIEGVIISGNNQTYKFANLNMMLEISDDKSALVVDADRKKVTAMISETLSDMGEVQSPAAKEEIKIKIKKMLNSYYGKEVIKEVYFTHFVVYR